MSRKTTTNSGPLLKLCHIKFQVISCSCISHVLVRVFHSRQVPPWVQLLVCLFLLLLPTVKRQAREFLSKAWKKLCRDMFEHVWASQKRRAGKKSLVLHSESIRYRFRPDQAWSGLRLQVSSDIQYGQLHEPFKVYESVQSKRPRHLWSVWYFCRRPSTSVAFVGVRNFFVKRDCWSRSLPFLLRPGFLEILQTFPKKRWPTKHCPTPTIATKKIANKNIAKQ